MPVLFKRALALLCAPLLALGLSACAKTVSTTGFTGEAKVVAETIKNLQTDVTAGEQKKICQNDLASTLVKRLSSYPGGCEQAIKNQLPEVASFELSVESIKVNGTTATARVKSIYSGKNRPATLTLVKEGSKWKISGLG
jgi:putative lumazine-binding protein